MISILKSNWHGVLALIWWVFGIIATVSVFAFFGSPGHMGSFYVPFVLLMLFGWIAPVLLLAFSGLRRGSIASRVCAILVLVTFAALALTTFIPPLPPDGH